MHRHEGFERTSNRCADPKVYWRSAKLRAPVDLMARVGSLPSFRLAEAHAQGADSPRWREGLLPEDPLLGC